MEILNIGVTEFIFIFIIILLVLGPTEMAKTGRKIGETVRKIRTSETWRVIQSASQGLRNIPNVLADETGIELDELKKDLVNAGADLKKDFRQATDDMNDGLNSWRQTTPPATRSASDKNDSEFASWTMPSEPYQPIAPPRPQADSPPTDAPQATDTPEQPE